MARDGKLQTTADDMQNMARRDRSGPGEKNVQNRARRMDAMSQKRPTFPFVGQSLKGPYPGAQGSRSR